MESIRKYGQAPFQIALLHGGPGAAGEMKPVAEVLSHHHGILELLQTSDSVLGQIEELHKQLNVAADLPAILIGYSWGAWLGLMFTGKYPQFVKKLILISSPVFESSYNKDLMSIRMGRLCKTDKSAAEQLYSAIKAGDSDPETLKQFGKLMSIADSYNYLPGEDEIIEINPGIYQSVWEEASRMRDSNELMKFAEGLSISVTAMHGDYDPHPLEGVEKPLSQHLLDFKTLVLKNCGHTPWRERFAKDDFYSTLLNEINLVSTGSR